MAKLTKIQITGQKLAFLVEDDDGRPLGTITQYRKGSTWVVYRGVGADARHIGNATKYDAVPMLTSATIN